MKSSSVVLLVWFFCSIKPIYASDPADTHDVQPTLQSIPKKVMAPPKSLHPDVVFLSKNGRKVLDDNAPLSLTVTCGACHDTEYIEKHNYHSQLGLDNPPESPNALTKQTQTAKPGSPMRFDPLVYRRLSAPGDVKLDLGKAAWIKQMGPRHVGGGTAQRSRDGRLLEELEIPDAVDAQTHVVDLETGAVLPWDFKQSGGVELNCLLCHMQNPDNQKRIEAIEGGQFRWASTATLIKSDIVEKTAEGYAWNRKVFNTQGAVANDLLELTDPPSANCRSCHGKACRCTDPVVFENSLQNWSAETTGTIFSPEPIRKSGMNLAGKSDLLSAWDVHAERLLGCIDCHHAPNNPAYNRKDTDQNLRDHLRFDARKLGIEDYLRKPDHNLVKGYVSQATLGRQFDGTMRDCRDCHRPEAVHAFLPFRQTHFEKLSCQTCHVPKVFAPARASTDWTLLDVDGQPVVGHRGIAGTINDPLSLIEGYRPIWLWHTDEYGVCRLGPHNLISSWYWVQGDPQTPVRYLDLYNALFEKPARYHPQVVSAFDQNQDGRIDRDELRLDTAEKINLMKSRLGSQGVDRPSIQASIVPYTIAHGVLSADAALRSCRACHSPSSRIHEVFTLAQHGAGGIVPRWLPGSDCQMSGGVQIDERGAWTYQPDLGHEKLYIHGAVRMGFLDLAGIVVLLATVLGVLLHGGLRMFSTSRKTKRGAKS